MGQYFKITIHSSPTSHELLIAELSMLNYEAFQETGDTLEAYIQDQDYDETQLLQILDKYGVSHEMKVEKIENMNWNRQWEENFTPTYVDDRVQIRASFHTPKPDYEFDIIIDPKMSFGTGHHETTHLIISEQLTIDHRGKDVLDVGTGTGVLSILAHKLKARSIVATDIDEWSIQNSRENFERNSTKNFEILKGTIDKLTLPGTYDIIFANINKNLLMAELPAYSKLLSNSGILLISGFYSEDIDDLCRKAMLDNLIPVHTKSRNNWAMIHLGHQNT